LTEVPLPVTHAKLPTELQPTTPTTEAQEKLPATASNVPLIGLAGIFALAIAVALKAFQKG
jgi:hypothetical protein